MTITLAIFFLMAEPRCYRLLRDELDEAFQDPLGDLPPAKLASLPYLEAVIHEALRLSTPFFLPRSTPETGTYVDGNFIPGGTIVALAAHSQQISPDNFFPDPQVSWSGLRADQLR